MQSEYTLYMQAAERYYRLPFSPVDGYAAQVYSQHINRTLCVATAPTGTDNSLQTWLGTSLGIKRVEAGKGVVHTYALRDGLPGDVVEDIAADKEGAVALIRLSDSAQALCWWDRKTDRWRQIARLSLQNTTYGNFLPTSRWRFVLTPTRLVLAPPRIETASPYVVKEGEAMPGSHLCIWQRSDLSVGSTTFRTVPWDRTLLEPSYNGSGSRDITTLAAVGETIFLGGGMGIVAVPEATLTAPVPGADHPAAPTFLSATPQMPRFFSEATVSALAVQGDTLYAQIIFAAPGPSRTELVKITPVVQGGLLLGIRQARTITPNVLHSQSRTSPLIPPQLVIAENGPWIISGTGFLHQTEAGWERRDLTGNVVPLEQEGKHTPGSFEEFGAFPEFLPPRNPIIAPTAEAIPDAVALAWLTSSASTFQERTQAGYRYIAWIRQRFPGFFSPAALPGPPPPRPTPESASTKTPHPYGGSAVSFVPDPQLSNTVWHSPNTVENHQTYLWQLPAKSLPPLYWSTYDNQVTPYINAHDVKGGKAIALPKLPIRVHLAVRGLVVRSDGIYIATQRGVLRIPQTSLNGSDPQFARGMSWVPQETAQGTKSQVFVSGSLFQVGTESNLYLSTNDIQQALLRYDGTRGQFVRETGLPLGQLAAGTKDGIFVNLTTVTKTAHSTSYSPGSTVSFLPSASTVDTSHVVPVDLRPPTPNTKPDTAPVLFGPDLPFLDNGLTQVGYTGSVIWFTGRIKTPAKPRYTRGTSGSSQYYGLAGYDVVHKRWSRVLELPESDGTRRVAVVEHNGQTFATFLAPDYCVWQYYDEHDGWAPIAPALPTDAAVNTNYDRAPQLWIASGGEVWLLTARGIYRHTPNTPWTAYPLPAVLAQQQQSSSEVPLLSQLADSLLVGTNYGLWCFDRVEHTWTEISPLAASLEDTPVSLFVQSVAADKQSVYLAGTARVEGAWRNDRVLLMYNKRGGWTSLSSTQLNLPDSPSITDDGRFRFDGKAVWYLRGTETRRRNPATGHWETVAGPERLQILRVPSVANAVFFTSAYKLERYDEITGKVQTLLDTNSYESGMTPIPPRGSRISGVTLYQGALLAATSSGIYRLSLTSNQGERLPLPSLQYSSFFTTDNGDVYGWDMNTIVHLTK